jgi:ketopantoate reductase
MLGDEIRNSGTGGGGYYSGLLAKNGHEVCVFARASNLIALRERGLRVQASDKVKNSLPWTAHWWP